MNNKINLIDQPELLEKYYQANKNNFVVEFKSSYPNVKGNPIAETWKARLEYPKKHF